MKRRTFLTLAAAAAITPISSSWQPEIETQFEIAIIRPGYLYLDWEPVGWDEIRIADIIRRKGDEKQILSVTGFFEKEDWAVMDPGSVPGGSSRTAIFVETIYGGNS